MMGLFYTDRHSGAVKQTEHGVVLKLFAKVLSIYLFSIMTDHLICRSFSLLELRICRVSITLDFQVRRNEFDLSRFCLCSY